jgi:hypothetical protein
VRFLPLEFLLVRSTSSASNACVEYERDAISSLSDDVRDQLLSGAPE